MWKPQNSSGEPASVPQHGGHALGVDAELLRAAAHLHAGRLELEIGIHADRDRAAACRVRCAIAARRSQLELGFDVDDDAGGHGALELGASTCRAPRN